MYANSPEAAEEYKQALLDFGIRVSDTPSDQACGRPPPKPNVIIDCVVKAPRQAVMENVNKLSEEDGDYAVVNPGPSPLGDLAIGSRMVRRHIEGWVETVVEFKEDSNCYEYKYVVNKVDRPCIGCCYVLRGFIGHVSLSDGPQDGETTVKFRGHLDHHPCCCCTPRVFRNSALETFREAEQP